VDDLLGELEKRLPDLEAFADTLADEIIAKIPGFIAAAKEALPGIIKGIQDFVSGVASFGKEIVTTLGPNGLVTAGLIGIGAKIGGFSGALAAAFTKGFADIGFGPFQSILLGTIAGAVTAGLVSGLASAAVTAAIGGLTARIGAATVAGAAASAAAAAATAGGAAAGVGGAAIAGAAALPVAIPLLLKAIGFGEGSLAVSGMDPAAIAAAKAKAAATSVNTTISIGKGAVTKASSVVSQASRTQVPTRATAR
jgi:hypothetical protein